MITARPVVVDLLNWPGILIRFVPLFAAGFDRVVMEFPDGHRHFIPVLVSNQGDPTFEIPQMGEVMRRINREIMRWIG